MIAKISVGNSLFGALAYNQDKVDQGKGKVLFTNKILESPDGKFDIHKCVECFNNHIPEGIRTKKNVIHISINPDPKDNLSDEQLLLIAQEYLEKLGYGQQPYMIFKHEDIDRHHLHIVSIRTDENGKKVNDKFEHYRSQKITRELEEKYNLHPATKKQITDRPEIKKVNYKAGDVKQQISSTVKALMNSYKFQSFTEYRALLSLYNICVEEIKGEVNGKIYNGIIYFAIDNKGNKKGNPIKSSRLGKITGYEAIQRKTAKYMKAIKDKKLKEPTRNIINEVLNNTRTRKQFEKELKKRGIDVIFRQNKDHRIYGVTFIDHTNKIVFNGSRLGKEFSANALEERFNQKLSQTLDISFHLPFPNISSGGFSSPLSSNETFGNDIYSVDQRKRRRKRRKKNL